MQPSNESQLGVSIAQQCNIIKGIVNDIAVAQSGICIVAENIEESKLIGYNNVIGPKCLIAFIGEEAVGGSDVSELLDMTRRYFDILVTRGRLQCDPLTSPLTTQQGIVMPFYDLIETIRDQVRSIEWPTPMCINPCEYLGTKPVPPDNGLIDSYIISISILTRIGRVIPPEDDDS